MEVPVSEREPERLRRRIEAFLAADPQREVTEDGELLFDLRETRYRLEEAHGKLLLQLWSAERNWVRRVVDIAEESAERLVLQVERFGQRQPGKLVVAATKSRGAGLARERSAARRKYRAGLRRLLAREFPRARLEGLSSAADLRRSFSGHYTRARLREGARWWAVLGVNAGEAAAVVDSLLTYGLIWFDWNRARYPERVWAGLRLFLPEGRSDTTASRLPYLARTRLGVELYAVDEELRASTRVDERDLGNWQTRLAPARHAEEVLAASRSAGSGVERIRALAPEGIEAMVPAGRRELYLRFRGLEFARALGGEVSFGVGRQEERLSGENFSALAELVACLRRERAAEGPPTSPYYRLQPERWLECVVRAAPQAIDPRLAPDHLYRQVPAVTAGERGVADLLGATRDGQLVVIELKASTDIHLALQGLDYWLRVRWHQQRGELARGGYFPGVNLKPDPPELLLVAPALQFHPATETVVGYLAPEVPVTLVGINEEWRRELKVVWRKGRRRRGR